MGLLRGRQLGAGAPRRISPSGMRAMLAAAVLAAAVLLVLPDGAWAGGTGHIRGVVTAQTGGGAIQGLEVCVEATSEFHDYCHESESGGKYEIEVPEGSYYVYFFPEECPGAFGECTPLNYLQQAYNDRNDDEKPDIVEVKSGETKSGIDAAMVTAGSLEGQVTAAVGGAQLQGVYVCAVSYEVFAYRCAYTEEEGFYSIVGLPTGKYLVFYAGGEECPPELSSCVHLNYVGQYYNGARTESKASPVPVVTGSETNGIGAELAVGAKIEGVVTAASGGAPAENIDVCARPQGEAAEGDCTHTGKTGAYTLEGLEGEYAVAFEGNATLGPVLYENATTTASQKLVKAVPPAVITGIDAALPAGGEISGVVTVAPSGAPIAGVDVCGYSEAEFEDCDRTNSAGEYTLKGVDGGYRVEFEGGDACDPECSAIPYVTQYYNGIYSDEHAEEVKVAPGAHVTGINARLAESIKQGEAETEARKAAEAATKAAEAAAKAAEAAAKKHGEEVLAKEAQKKREAEAKAAEEAAKSKAAEEHRRAEAAAIASVRIVRIRSKGATLLITLKVARTETVTVAGKAVKRTVAHLKAGTHLVKVHLSALGRSARRRNGKIKLAITFDVGQFAVSLNRLLKI